MNEPFKYLFCFHRLFHYIRLILLSSPQRLRWWKDRPVHHSSWQRPIWYRLWRNMALVLKSISPVLYLEYFTTWVMWHSIWVVAAGTDATHADHIETIKSRMYVGLTADQRFLPGELGMGLVEGNKISISLVLQFLKNGLIIWFVWNWVFQGITQWGMRCLNHTWERSWRLTLNLCQRAERTKLLSSVIMWPNTRLFLSSPWERQRSKSECSTAKINEIYSFTFVPTVLCAVIFNIHIWNFSYFLQIGWGFVKLSGPCSGDYWTGARRNGDTITSAKVSTV